MQRVTVGYVEFGVHPLRVVNLGFWAARLLGAHALWIPDHYMGFTPPHVWTREITPAARTIHSLDAFFDPLLLLAVAAKRCRRMDIGTAVTEAVRRHPMSLAQSFVTLDHISGGRAILGIGGGERCSTKAYGLPWERQASRLEEALTIIRLLWESHGAPVSYDGTFWKLKDAVFDLPLHAGRPPRVWVAAHGPRMLALTGRLADGWLPFLKVRPEEYARRLGVIREAAAAAGRTTESFVAGQLLFPLVLGRSRDHVLETVLKSRLAAAIALMAPDEVWGRQGVVHPLGKNHRGFFDLAPQDVTPEHIDQALAKMTPEILLSFMYMGNPSEVRDELVPLVDAGARHLALSNAAALFADGELAHLWRLRSLIQQLKRL